MEWDILSFVEMASLLSKELGLVKVLTAIATDYVSDIARNGQSLE
jgi:hypothetical protein